MVRRKIIFHIIVAKFKKKLDSWHWRWMFCFACWNKWKVRWSGRVGLIVKLREVECPSISWFKTLKILQFEILQKILEQCRNKRKCKIMVKPSFFGTDPCPRTSKYLQLSYKCKPGEQLQQSLLPVHRPFWIDRRCPTWHETIRHNWNVQTNW